MIIIVSVLMGKILLKAPRVFHVVFGKYLNAHVLAFHRFPESRINPKLQGSDFSKEKP